MGLLFRGVSCSSRPFFARPGRRLSRGKLSTFLRAFGPPIVLTAPLTIGLIITGTPGPFTLNQLDSAYPIIGAGATVAAPVIYRYTDFLIEVWRALRAWIFAAGVAQGLVPVGTANDVQLSLTVTFPNDQNDLYNNATRITLSIPAAGLGFVGTAITGVIIQNSGTTSAWAHLLGLFAESDPSGGMALALGVFRKDGEFQPRGLTVLLRSEQDSGEYEERQDYRTVVLGSGKVVPYNYGFAEVRRDLRLVSLHPTELAPQFHLGVFLSLDVTRFFVHAPNPDTTGAGGSGVFGIGSTPPGLQTDRIAVGDYLRLAEQWVGRVRDISVPLPGTGDIEIELWEAVPANIAPAPGAPIYKLSEVHALLLESLRLGGLFVYDVDDVSGQWRASGPLYQLRGEGKLLLQFERQQPQAADRYAFGFNLVRSSAPGLVVVS